MATITASYSLVCSNLTEFNDALAWLANTTATITLQDQNSLTINFTSQDNMSL